jgi:GH25 family lysozyme M1 (1,4-beta-N-acetylmuramidase)
MTWLLGLDAARWQGKLKGNALDGCVVKDNAGKVVGPVKFAYFKATHGTGGVDEQFVWNATSSAPMKRRGFYMWLVPTQDPLKQADHFCDVVSEFDRPTDLPPAIDFEDDGNGRVRGKALLDIARACVMRVEERLGLRRSVLYTGKWFWQQACADIDDDFFAKRPLWHAQYPGHVVSEGEKPAIAKPWASRNIAETFWQFDGDKGLFLPGEATALGKPVDADFNRFMGSEEDLDTFTMWARTPSVAACPPDPDAMADDWRKPPPAV